MNETKMRYSGREKSFLLNSVPVWMKWLQDGVVNADIILSPTNFSRKWQKVIETYERNDVKQSKGRLICERVDGIFAVCKTMTWIGR